MLSNFKRRWLIAGVVIVLLIGAAAVFLLTQPPADPFRGAAVTDPAFTPLTYGIQTELWWDGGEVGFYLYWIQAMGFSHIKQVFSWKDMEPSPGDWRFNESDRIIAEAEARNLQVVARLGIVPDWAHSTEIVSSGNTDIPPDDLDQWAHYCGTVAERYRGRITAYQIWNEPNLSREWGNHAPNAAAYVELLAACSEAIRALDPDAILISAGLAPTGNMDDSATRDDIYLNQMYEAGFQQYIDVVGVHAVGYDAPEVGPDDAVEKGRQRFMSFRRVEDMRKIMIEHGDAARQVAILETGWTTDEVNPHYSWFAVSEEQQGEYLVRAYRYAAENWRPWVGLMSMIYMGAPTWTEQDEQYWWAITEPRRDDDGRITIHTRPALDSLLRMPKFCGEITVPALPEDEEIPLEPVNPCN